MQVKVYRYVGSGQGVLQGLTFGAVNVTQAGVYTFPLLGRNGVSYSDVGAPSPRDYYSSGAGDITAQQGTLTLTRFDPQQGIVASTFAFTLEKASGSTLTITQGNFEAHL